MSTIYVPGLMQIRPQYSEEPDAPDHPENVTWWLGTTTAPYTLGEIASIAAAFDAKWGPMWNAVGGDNMHYYGAIYTDWGSDTGLTYNSVGTYEGEVGSNGTLQPPNVAALISGQVGIRYRGGHPRIYLPYVGASALTDEYSDSLSPSAVESCTSAYTDLQSIMSTGSGYRIMNQVLYRRKTGDVLRWDSFVVNGLLATQRRRLRRPSRRR